MTDQDARVQAIRERWKRWAAREVRNLQHWDGRAQPPYSLGYRHAVEQFDVYGLLKALAFHQQEIERLKKQLAEYESSGIRNVDIPTAVNVFASPPSQWDAIGAEVDRLRAAGLIAKPLPAAPETRETP